MQTRAGASQADEEAAPGATTLSRHNKLSGNMVDAAAGAGAA